MEPHALLGSLSLDQKVRLLTGADFWSTHAEPAIGLRAMALSDGPAGVRGTVWDERDPSLNLPCGSALGASWDPSLAGEYGAVLAAQARAKGVHVVLGPTINLHRSPLGGRHFEAFSEDPVLTAGLAAALVRGLQRHGVAATPKHYVANDSETERFTLDVEVSERALRELYLAPFEAVVEAGTWAVMSAYNSVHGTTMTEHELLASPLCTEWGFDGVVVSDWTAVRGTEASARARQDLVMPGPHGPWGDALLEAVRAGRVPEAAIDEKVLRLLRLAERVGALDGAEQSAAPPVVAGTEFARRAAAESFVLLHDTGELPWRIAPASLAVLGEHAIEPRTQGGGSASVVPADVVSVLDGLRTSLPETSITAHLGVTVHSGLKPLALEVMREPETGVAGIRVRFLDAEGAELGWEHRQRANLVWLDTVPDGTETVELRTDYLASESGTVRFGIGCAGTVELLAGERTVLAETMWPQGQDLGAALFEPPVATAELEVTEGSELPLTARVRPLGPMLAVTLGTKPEPREPSAAIAEAAAVAAESEVAVVVVGTSEQTESEGFDRASLTLPGEQDRLVRAVAAANPRTIVLVNSGSPVCMPWRDGVAAIMLTWFGGEQLGNAVADVLRGEREPGGRLPSTWPDREADVPVLDTAPRSGVLHYAEDVHLGYRAWLRAGTRPAFPFGHGLGYTSWSLEDLTVRGTELRVTVRNTGARAGKQVIQAYLSAPESTVDRPVRWLAAFTVVRAEPGEQTIVELVLPERAFAHWDGGWRQEPGRFTVHVGTSAEQLPLSAEIQRA